MEERKDHIKRLIQRWMENTITPEEKGELGMLLNEQTFFFDVEPGLQEMWDTQTNQRILSKNRSEEEIDLQPPVHRIHFMRRWGWAAASVIIILGMGVFLWTTKKK